MFSCQAIYFANNNNLCDLVYQTPTRHARLAHEKRHFTDDFLQSVEIKDNQWIDTISRGTRSDFN